jgi:hypothetical protein
VPTTLKRRRWAARTAALTALVLAGVATAAVVARETGPAPALTGHRIATSLATEAGGAAEGVCVRERRGRWSCDILSESGQRLAAYDVEATSRSCWRASRTTRRADGPATVAGCLH